jgi:hypothetical protein
MSDYFKAYRARLERNQAQIIQLIKDVQEKDNSVEAYVYDQQGSRLLSGVTFIKEESVNSIHFHEVPYRWSGCGYGEHGNSHYGGENSSMPFTADDVLSTFRPINTVRWRYVNKNPNDHSFIPYRDKKHYLEWNLFLKPFKHEEKSNNSNTSE